MESRSQLIVSPFNSLLKAMLPFVPKLREKRTQSMSKVNVKNCPSLLLPGPCC